MAPITVLYGSVRSGRQGIKAARFVVQQLERRGHTVTLIDPLELELPLLDRMYKEFDKAPEPMETIHEALDSAEGIVVVSAEYNHSVPAALKNLLDHFQQEYYCKPAGIVTYSAGPFAGTRAQVHLRVILGELGMVTPSIMFGISKVQDAFDDRGTDLSGEYTRRIQKFLDEFEWYVDALRGARLNGIPF